jgi:hypothetical protein
MGYVDDKRRSSPVGLGAAIAVNGSIILAVALSPLVVEPAPPGQRLEGKAITLAPPPPPPDVDEQKTKPKISPIFIPKRIVDTPTRRFPGHQPVRQRQSVSLSVAPSAAKQRVEQATSRRRRRRFLPPPRATPNMRAPSSPNIRSASCGLRSRAA